MKIKELVSYIFNYKILGTSVLRWQKIRVERRLKRKKPDPANPLNPPLVSTARMKEIVSKHYLQGRYVNGIKKVAWVTSGAPIEILRALDFFILYPEKHAAICGARKQAVEISIEAEKFGFSQDICSYARTDIGAALSGKTPVAKLPKPDLLLACTNICQTVLFWYNVLAEYFNVPLILIDTPFLYEHAKNHEINFVIKQIEEMIPVAEQIAGKNLSYKKLQKIIKNSKQAAELWQTILNRAKTKPAPFTAFDSFIHLAPIVDQRGKRGTINYYKTLLHEIDHRIKNGFSAVKNEEKRVLWDNLPIWFKIREHSKLLANHGVNVVAATYSSAWGELAPLMDAKNPIESMAKVYLHPILNRTAQYKLETMKKMIGDFQIDGVILHSDRSCKPYSLGQIDQREKLLNDYKIPTLLLEADHNDSRVYSQNQAENRIEAFVEMLHAR